MSTNCLSQASVLLLSFIIITNPTISQLTTGNIGCFVDLSEKSDRKTDIVTFVDKSVTAFTQISADGHVMKDKFQQYAQFNTTNANVISVSAMDWTKNGVSDLFVVTQTHDHPLTYNLHVWKDDHGAFVSSGASVSGLSDPHVLIVDADGDFTADVFGKSQDHNEGFWFGNHQTNSFDDFFALNADAGSIDMQSVSFIDLDQDCKADLVYITTAPDASRHVRMISHTDFRSSETRESVHLITMLPDYQSRLYFADLNNDGVMDIIIPNRNQTLHVFVQDTAKALDFKRLCLRKVAVTFEPSGGCDVILESGDYKLRDNLPIIIQDINMDRKTNLVAVLQDGSGHQDVFATTLSYKDVDDLNGKRLESDNNIGHLFTPYTDGENRIDDMAFFHSGEFPLGLYFVIRKKDETFDFINLEPKLNDKNYGFLSVCPLNDVDPTEKKYGGTMPGVMVKAFFRSSNGHSIFLSAGSLYQTNSGNHLLPFIVFGLGEPESYIEKLVIGYSLHGEPRFFQQPGVPPNSQLVLFAHGTRWRLETFLAPYMTASMLAVIITLVMTVLGGMWVYLEIKEKKSMTDDKLKGSSTTHNFFF